MGPFPPLKCGLRACTLMRWELCLTHSTITVWLCFAARASIYLFNYLQRLRRNLVTACTHSPSRPGILCVVQMSSTGHTGALAAQQPTQRLTKHYTKRAVGEQWRGRQCCSGPHQRSTACSRVTVKNSKTYKFPLKQITGPH